MLIAYIERGMAFSLKLGQGHMAWFPLYLETVHSCLLYPLSPCGSECDEIQQ